ncbi:MULTISPECIES: hypothetical protein [Paraburkholderia]|uniref:hypothetical protein n=1 Tax=Paraburkholderia TaxID=1822464 RepID=UPI0022558373|nr:MULTISPECIES: hypothetical protein [Paraburkholderia]MCX4165040.1 hypothetical protein [Paraburkholderia megapolitana]MDN7160533.1 hypothetical protein [Paraburkholderia sp. CHISQ3]MDQ6497580.1 hypothetical protein [Paraburkholderia megapolitana]
MTSGTASRSATGQNRESGQPDTERASSDSGRRSDPWHSEVTVPHAGYGDAEGSATSTDTSFGAIY